MGALGRAPILLGWLILGPVVAWVLDGPRGLGYGLLNLALLGGWALLIARLTTSPPAPLPLRRPRLELALGIAYWALLLVVLFLLWGVLRVSPLIDWVIAFERVIYRAAYDIAGRGTPDWLASLLATTVSNTILMTLPILALSLALGYGPARLGLRARYLGLMALLVALSLALGLPGGMLPRQPLAQSVVTFALTLLATALPQALIFQGFLLPRLEAVLGNSLNAVAVSALLLNALHVPVALAHGAGAPTALLEVVSIGQPTGLILGYLYLRTRTVVPGIPWHAAQASRLGVILAGLAR
ncbi:MAG: CPBP family intramembrane metalloprotease [Thermomicrobiaceae bacterium]|nr:CPBP family intramembrane metalloprotease [Thermomicrobiaceae bacterium]